MYPKGEVGAVFSESVLADVNEFVVGDLQVDREYDVVIRAENAEGMSEEIRVSIPTSAEVSNDDG